MLRRVPAEFALHYNRRETQKLVSLFCDDGVCMPPFRAAAQGHAALRKLYEETFQQMDPRDLRIEISHVEYDDNAAFEHGTCTLNVRLPDGSRLDDRGKWIATFRRERNDQWRLAGLCWNSDLDLLNR
ncbi:MAG: nuclear transport factor 2 family protein [Candidatus Korobacteraceae bacterium]